MSVNTIHGNTPHPFLMLVVFFVLTATDILAQGTLPDNVQTSDCNYTPEAFQWGITEKWSSEVNVSTLLIPMVGDVDGDEIPEIVCFAPSGDDYYNANTVLMFDSQTHEVIHSFTIPGNVSTVDASPYGIVKLHNGHVLFAVCAQNYTMYGYDLTSHGTSPMWTASTQQVAPNVAFVDFNGDGYPEIYVGKRIYDAETGALLIDPTSVTNVGGSYAQLAGSRLSSPFATNILGDAHPELILGNEIYSFNITNRTGLDGNTMTLAQSCTPPSGVAVDGHTQVADFNLDGYLDVFISNKNASGSSDVGCYVWDVHNNSVSQPLVITTIGSGKSIPLIADIDGDNLVEMVIQCNVSGNKIRAYKYNPTSSSFTMIWDFAVDEDSFSNSATTFDFNHDNEMEILISDQSRIKIVEGTTGTTITELSFGECTVMQYPIIADVDADGSAEIAICGQYGSGHTNSGHLVVFCSPTTPWAPARKVWNQYMYNVTNINEDLSVPTYVFNNATPFTWQGTTRRPYNNFLQQATIIDQHGNPFYAVPDVAMNTTDFSYTTNGGALDFTYSNPGGNTLNAPYTITVFVDQIGGTVLRTLTIDEPLLVDATVQQHLNLSMEELCQWNGHNIVVAVNCDGGGIAQDGGLQPECDISNNTGTIPVSIEPTETSVIETACDAFTWNGQTYTQSGNYSLTFQNIYGCDSIVTLSLTINPSEDIGPNAVTECDAYAWHGTTYTQSGTYEFDTLTEQGCQRHETLILTINYSEVIDPVIVTECDTYIWHGTTYAQSGSYEYNSQTPQGCNRHETLQLTISDSNTYEWFDEACDEYLWNGLRYTSSGDYVQQFTNGNGCDSTVTLHLTINPSETHFFVDEACDEYNWNGTTYATSGYYTQDLHSSHGCDSTVTLNLTIYRSVETAWRHQSCHPYTWNGITYNATGDYTQSFTTVHGCDSIVTLHLTINNEMHTEWSHQACYNYTWNGTTYNATGDYTQSFVSQQGCDSIVTLHLVINELLQTEWDYESCDEYTWNSTTYNTSGDYTQRFTSIQGCDSIATLHLTINPSVTTERAEESCDEYSWNGTTYNTSGDYIQQFYTSHSCDSTVILHLTINNVIHTDWSQQACESYTWNNVPYNATGDYTQNFVSQHGCDSIVTMHLTISDAIQTEMSQQVCEHYIWNGITYQATGDYTQSFTSVQGCDSIVTLHLTINDVLETEWSQQAYNSFTWNGITYDVSGDYVQNFTSQQVCDSVVTLHLTIDNEVVNNEWSASACDSYEWNGVTYDATGDYTQHFPSQHEGDSIVVLHLTLYQATATEWSDHACDIYEWNGMTYNSSGDYTQQFTTQHGCDSTVTLHLTINNSTTTHINETACNKYEWHGTTYYESGVYNYTGQSITGCDSIVVLNLSMETGLPVNIQGEASIYTATNLVSGSYTYFIDSTNIDPAHVHWGISRDDWQIEPHRASCKVFCLTTGEATLRAWTEGEFCDIDTTLLLSGSFYDVGENDDSSLSIYPNPTKGFVTISWHDIEEVTVIDILGQRLTTCQFGKTDSCEIDLSAFSHGVYVLEIVSAAGKVYRAVVREER